MVLECPNSVCEQMPVLASQNEIVLSPEQENSVFVNGWNPV